MTGLYCLPSYVYCLQRTQTFPKSPANHRWEKVLLAITSGFVTEVARLGGFKHLMFVPLENGTRVALSLLIAQCFNICAFGTGKFSVGLLLLGVLSKTSTWRKWFIWVLICVTLAYNVAEGILMLFQCEPARAAWDPMVKGQCWSMNKKLTNIYVGGGELCFSRRV
jgi:hypothetical protein